MLMKDNSAFNSLFFLPELHGLHDLSVLKGGHGDPNVH